MAYTVNALSPVDWPTYNPFLSSPYYHYNRDVLPTRPKPPALHQNDNQHVLYRDAIVSVMLQQLKGIIRHVNFQTRCKIRMHSHSHIILTENSKRLADTSKRLAETNVVVNNVKGQVTQLQNELAQITKSAEEKDKAEMLQSQSNGKNHISYINKNGSKEAIVFKQ